MRIDFQQLAHTHPIDDNRIGAVGVAFADDAVEILDKVLFATLVLCCYFILLVGIENGAVVFMLAQVAHVVRIDASLLVDGGTALDDSVQITLGIVVEAPVRQDAGDG